MNNEKKGPIQKWAEKIDWKSRVKAVCKPCWEIKYCPYGPLIEDFPLQENPDEKACRIFGHDCPVYYMAEPFTETKELRRVSRSIPRATQFRVLKRENQICRMCGISVQDEDIHFDHIIPYSKGGSSDEHNVRLLCSECNLKRNNNYEDEFLVSSFTEHVSSPVDSSIIGFFTILISFFHEFFASEKKLPSATDIAKALAGGEKTEIENHAAEVITDFHDFFTSNRPKDMKLKEFEALKYRWGFKDGELYFLAEAAKTYDIDLTNLFTAEIGFIKRLGWNISLNKTQQVKWMKT